MQAQKIKEIVKDINQNDPDLLGIHYALWSAKDEMQNYLFKPDSFDDLIENAMKYTSLCLTNAMGDKEKNKKAKKELASSIEKITKFLLSFITIDHISKMPLADPIQEDMSQGIALLQKVDFFDWLASTIDSAGDTLITINRNLGEENIDYCNFYLSEFLALSEATIRLATILADGNPRDHENAYRTRALILMAKELTRLDRAYDMHIGVHIPDQIIQRDDALVRQDVDELEEMLKNVSLRKAYLWGSRMKEPDDNPDTYIEATQWVGQNIDELKRINAFEKINQIAHRLQNVIGVDVIAAERVQELTCLCETYSMHNFTNLCNDMVSLVWEMEDLIQSTTEDYLTQETSLTYVEADYLTQGDVLKDALHTGIVVATSPKTARYLTRLLCPISIDDTGDDAIVYRILTKPCIGTLCTDHYDNGLSLDFIL